MKIVLVIIVGSFFLQSCTAQPLIVKRGSYCWGAIEDIPRDSLGRVSASPFWNAYWRIGGANTPLFFTYIIYGNYDSIQCVTSDGRLGNFFRKVTIHAAKWKPKPEYDHLYFFLGTYEEANMDGSYFSFYVTKDWSSTLEILYTNPGNMMHVMWTSKTPVNMLQKEGFIIEPEDESAEPDLIEMKIDSVTIHKIRDQN